MSLKTLTLCLLVLFGCRTTSGSKSSKTLDDPNPTVEISPPWRSGVAEGDLRWESRFNFPPCDYSAEGYPKGVYCRLPDKPAAVKKSGIEDSLTAWMNDPAIKSVHLAYFSFSNSGIRKALCKAATTRSLKVYVYIHRQNLASLEELANCSSNIVVVPRGTEFGVGYLQHSKIFMASVEESPLALHEHVTSSAPEVVEAVKTSRTRFTSSSANMSANGTGMHLENWLLFDSPTTDHLAQTYICFFRAMKQVAQGDGNVERESFATINKDCQDKITGAPREDLKFYAVPHGNLTARPQDAVKTLIAGAQQSIKIAIHRLTTMAIVGPLAERAKNGLPVTILYDDDTLRMSKCDGGPALDIGADDANGLKKLIEAGVTVKFLQSNGEIGQLHHNKFMIVDDKTLLQGAGNFTATSLNLTADYNPKGFGNMENFMVINEANIVKAYVEGWDYLNSVATDLAAHPVGNHPSRLIKEEIVQGRRKLSFDDTPCQAPQAIGAPSGI